MQQKPLRQCLEFFLLSKTPSDFLVIIVLIPLLEFFFTISVKQIISTLRGTVFEGN